MKKLLTMAELEHKSEPELQHLFRELSTELTCTERFSRDRQNRLASLENISRAQDMIWWRRPEGT